MDEHVARLVAAAPPLTPEQTAQLHILVASVGAEATNRPGGRRPLRAA